MNCALDQHWPTARAGAGGPGYTFCALSLAACAALATRWRLRALASRPGCLQKDLSNVSWSLAQAVLAPAPGFKTRAYLGAHQHALPHCARGTDARCSPVMVVTCLQCTLGARAPWTVRPRVSYLTHITD